MSAGYAPAGRWLPLVDAAKELGVSSDTVRRRVRRSELAGRHEHGRLFVEMPTFSAAAMLVNGIADDVTIELAVLHARVTDLERERLQLIEDRDSWREQAHRSDAHVEQLTQRLPTP